MACTTDRQSKLSRQMGGSQDSQSRLLWRFTAIQNGYDCKWKKEKKLLFSEWKKKIPFQAAVGIELWTMSADILFDNIIITSDEDAADEWAAKTYDLKRKQIDRESVSNFSSTTKITLTFLWSQCECLIKYRLRGLWHCFQSMWSASTWFSLRLRNVFFLFFFCR